MKNENITNEAIQSHKYDGYETEREPIFRICNLQKDEHVRKDLIDFSLLLFVLEGKVRISTGIYLQATVENGQMFVIHKGDNCYVRCLEDAVVMVCGFNNSMALCNGLSLNKTSISNILPPPHRLEVGLPCLKIQDMLMLELDLTRREVESKMLSRRFMEFKRFIILSLICSLYNKDSLFYMFRWVQSDDFYFREEVFKHLSYNINAQELCALMGMSTATFNRKFKKAFGLPVGEWLNNKRKVNVLMDLKTTDLTINEIAAKYNLTPNYLTNFCKTHLGDVPSNLRGGK